MERILLCLLCLSGWMVSSCLSRQYHYVKDPMTWAEAQIYCRKTYTDLATAENTDEMGKLKSSVPPRHHNGHVWIGLYSKIQWKWSDGYTGTGSDYRNWYIKDNEPDFKSAKGLCVSLNKEGKWRDEPCQDNQTSICYRRTQQDPDFYHVRSPMSWSKAQKSSRKNCVDLATVRDDTQTKQIQNILRFLKNDEWAWIGLYRDPELYWSDGSEYSFQFWREGSNPLGSMSVVCGAAYLPDSGKWNLKSCEDRFPFVCYSSGSKHVIKLRMKPDDPSVDLNDPAVTAGILRELQDRLKVSGLSGATLRWREQPDGKVFHKEEETGTSSEERKFSGERQKEL